MAVFKRSILIVLASLVALALAIIVYLFSGSAAIESWVGSQLLSLGGSYLQPELHFGRLRYHRPRTILVEDLTLSSPDPTRPGQSVVILAIKRARLELTEIPRPGEPIKFAQVILESPEFRAIALTPGSGGLVGFSHLLKTSSVATTPSLSATAPSLKLSDFLLMRRVEIVHGLIRYDPRLPHTQPMELDDINARLDLAPSSATPGLYTLQTTIARKPIFQLDVQGQFNIDTLVAQLASLAVTLDMRKENAHFLPPEIQALLNTFEMTGGLHIAVSGTIPLANFQQSTLHASAGVSGAGFAVGPYRFGADSFDSAVEVANGMATIQKADAHLLGGEVHVAGAIPLDPAKPARLELAARHIQIEKTLRAADPGVAPLYAGNVAADVTFTAPLGQWRSAASGNGTFTVRDGRIDTIPVVGQIITSVTKVVSKALGGSVHSRTDTADAAFTLAGDHVQFDHLAAKTGELALRGDGAIGFDKHLDLRLNVGPMERLQNMMGPVGKVWAAASDSIAGYRVTGTLGDPQVSFEVGGK